MTVLTANQQQLFERVRTESRQRRRQTLRRAALTLHQRRQLPLAKEKLNQASLVLNLSLRRYYQNERVIDNLLRLGRLLTLIEAEDFRDGIYDARFRDRLLNEFKIYGATRNAQMIFSHMHDSERPIYAALDYLNRPDSIAPIVRFGHHRFVLKPEAKFRSTFTPADSFMVEREQVYVWEDIEGVLASRLNGRFWFEHVLASTEPFSTVEGIYYIEAQILGGVHLSDMERLYYPATDTLDREFFAKLKRLELDHGIQLEQY